MRPGSTLPRSPSRQRLVGLAQPALDRAPVARLGEQRRRVRGGRRDEFLALACAPPCAAPPSRQNAARRAHRPFRTRRRSVPTALWARPRAAGRALSIRCAASGLRRRAAAASSAGCEQRFGALAELHAGLVLAERFPALELRQLLHEPAQPLHRRLRQHTGRGLARADLVGGRARRLQLSRGERLLRGVQQRVHVRARAAWRPAAPPGSARAGAARSRSARPRSAASARACASRDRAPPALRQVGVVDRRAGGELSRLRRRALRRRRARARSCSQPRDAAAPPRRASRAPAASSWLSRCRATPRARRASTRTPPHRPAAAARSIHSRNRRSNCARVRCSSRSRSNRACTTCAGGFPARAARLVAGEVERLPAPIESTTALTIGPACAASASAAPGSRRLRLLLAFALGDRIEPLAGKARHAAILVLRGLGDLAQALGRRTRPAASWRVSASSARARGRPAALRRGCARSRCGDGRDPACGARHRRGWHRCTRPPSRNAVAAVASAVSESTPPSAVVTAARTAGSDSVFRPRQAPAAPSTAAPRRCGLPARDRSASSRASSPESGGNAATPCTRCAGSSCSCSAEREKILAIIVEAQDGPFSRFDGEYWSVRMRALRGQPDSMPKIGSSHSLPAPSGASFASTRPRCGRARRAPAARPGAKRITRLPRFNR